MIFLNTTMLLATSQSFSRDSHVRTHVCQKKADITTAVYSCTWVQVQRSSRFSDGWRPKDYERPRRKRDAHRIQTREDFREREILKRPNVHTDTHSSHHHIYRSYCFYYILSKMNKWEGSHTHVQYTHNLLVIYIRIMYHPPFFLRSILFLLIIDYYYILSTLIELFYKCMSILNIHTEVIPLLMAHISPHCEIKTVS